jgi:SAM-dependent methyltransferase
VTERLGIETGLGSYEEVAAEYYSRERHPTCANFREGSQLLLERLVSNAAPGESCEVGAGDSLLADLLWRRGEDVGGLLITDIGPRMLEHSRLWAERGATLRRAAASELPVADASLGLLVASLADPYDDEAFWAEAARVLAPGGRCVITSPSAIWADGFRGPGSTRSTAEFELADGRTVRLRSHVREPEAERELIEEAGLRVVEEAEASRSHLRGPASPKLAFLGPADPVVRGFVAERPGG